jgi:hypothetical protein
MSAPTEPLDIFNEACLMGLPPVFYRCVVLAMASLRRLRPSSSKATSKRATSTSTPGHN